jgi:5-methylcytosine-specific restriction enzyme B
MLFQSNIGPSKKRENVRQVWSWSGEELGEDHPMLSDSVLEGLGSAGTAYNTQRWREVAFLIGALRDLKGRTQAERERLLGDPWIFGEWLSGQPGSKNRQLPHILSHLVFPDSFERISSAGDKQAIVAAFGAVSLKEARKLDFPSLDRKLLEIRQRFEQERGGDVDFYDDQYRKVWRDEARSWLLSWNPEKWDWATLSNDRSLTRSGQTVVHQWRCASTFPSEGDQVYLVRTSVDPKGIVASGIVARASYEAEHFDPARADAGDMTRFIDVKFSDVRDADQDQIVPLSILQAKAPDQTWNPQSSGIEIAPKAAGLLAKLWKETVGQPRDNGVSASSAVGPALDEETSAEAANQSDISKIQPEYTIEQFVAETNVPKPFVDQWLTALHRKGQIVLQGPPGTGKTFIAQRLARLLVSGGAGISELVQFHPSYAYEDFIEGIRPNVVNEGGLKYSVTPGRFVSFCKRADVASAPSVMIVDELNRANLSRVFGELMYLLEYRDAEIPLSSGGRLRIPRQVYLIGTMNTADRSIALVDHALRRRFAFIYLEPDYSILERELSKHGLPAQSLLETLRKVNAVIDDRNFSIGVSYFLKDGPNLKATLEGIWRTEIEPYLEEYFYDQPSKAKDFCWAELRQKALADWT